MPNQPKKEGAVRDRSEDLKSAIHHVAGAMYELRATAYLVMADENFDAKTAALAYSAKVSMNRAIADIEVLLSNLEHPKE